MNWLDRDDVNWPSCCVNYYWVMLLHLLLDVICWLSGNITIMAIEGDWVNPYDSNLFFNYYGLWLIMTSSIEAWLVINLCRRWYDFELKCLYYVIVILFLRWNEIRFVMNYLCALLWCDDDVMLISHMRVVMKGYSHAIPNELMTNTIQGIRTYNLN